MSQLHVEQLNGLKISALLLRTKGQAEALRIWLRPGEQKDSSSAGVRCVDSLWKEPAICANSLLRASRAREISAFRNHRGAFGSTSIWCAAHKRQKPTKPLRSQLSGGTLEVHDPPEPTKPRFPKIRASGDQEASASKNHWGDFGS